MHIGADDFASIRKPGHISKTTRLPFPSSTKDTTPATEGVPSATGSLNTPRFSRKALAMARGRSQPFKGPKAAAFLLACPPQAARSRAQTDRHA